MVQILLFNRHIRSKGYGVKKNLSIKESYQTRGIELLMPFEDEVRDNIDIVLSRIENKLGHSKRIGARTLKIVDISGKQGKHFFDETHIQRGLGAKIILGLSNGNDILCAMSFGASRFNKNFEWELVRFSSRPGISVIGGASKLFKEFREKYLGSDSIISFADKRWSNGLLYRILGFTELRISAPNYFYVKDGIRFSRVKAQKHKLPILLGDKFDHRLTEIENMHAAGYERIFDCGNIVFGYNGKENETTNKFI